jgi:hypothetical protein
MSFDTVAVIKEAHNANDANSLLEQGWRLLGFVATSKDGGMTYVMGRPKSRSASAIASSNDPEGK